MLDHYPVHTIINLNWRKLLEVTRIYTLIKQLTMKDLTSLQIHSKLTVVTRRDISPGYQAVQSIHAGIQFQHEFPKIAKQWHNESNYLAMLSTEDESSLIYIIEKCHERGLSVSVFREPDIGNQITAIAIEPSSRTKKICGSLPLALKEL